MNMMGHVRVCGHVMVCGHVRECRHASEGTYGHLYMDVWTYVSMWICGGVCECVRGLWTYGAATDT